MSADRQLFGQLTFPENFDAVTAAVGKPQAPESGFIDAGAVIKLIQRINIDGEVIRAMAGVIEAPFRNAANERHLAAFKPDPDGTTRAGGLPLATAAAGLAMAAGFTLAEPLAAMLGAGTRFKIV